MQLDDDGRRRHAGSSAVLLVLAGVALAGCGMSDGPGSLFVDPGRYDAYHCNELAARWKYLIEREQTLHNLMNKASEASGGGVIGSIAYGADYDSVLTEKKIVQREAAEKKCELVPAFQSDQTIN
ncbi:MAG TPA: hypothetical protein VMR17_15975 [Xanthobacteraceae bacterium]|jgi:hypothetical protein|nr:hypothetical protein [Xanthobacteraceae bacterium]